MRSRSQLFVLLLVVGCSRPPKVETPKPVATPPTVLKPAPPNRIPVPKPQPELIVDSNLTLDEALARNRFPQAVLDNLALVDVDYYSFDGKKHRGQIVIRQDLAVEVKAIFKDIEKSKEPIAKAIPIVRYGWSDDRSMADNNTSGFNYRTVNDRPHGSLSEHARGRAIDINPRMNPFEAKRGGWPYPYHPGTPGTLSPRNPITIAFRKRGWSWGGNWAGKKDFQHFVKR